MRVVRLSPSLSDSSVRPTANRRIAKRIRAPKTLVDEAYAAIKTRILSNDFAPGVQVLERDLSALLGMSRTPVHQALARLEGEQLLELTPRHGMRVLPVSATDMQEIFQLLTSLEATAVQLLARKSPTVADLMPMRKACEAMEQALERDDLHAWAAADEAFHTQLLNQCGNRRIASVCFNFWDQAHRARMITLHLRPKPVSSTTHHGELLDALLRGDEELALRIHTNQRLESGDIIIDLLKRSNLKFL
jgi:DNA-binding GntR family transcriptional regulator